MMNVGLSSAFTLPVLARFSGRPTPSAPYPVPRFSGSRAGNVLKTLGVIVSIPIILIGGVFGVKQNNTPPADSVATISKRFSFLNSAYVLSNGDVVSAWSKWRIGHVNPNGDATNMLGLPVGHGDSDGSIHGPLFNMPIGSVDSSGNVYKMGHAWMNYADGTVEGNIPTAEKGGAAILSGLLDSDSSSSSSSSSSRSSRR